MGLRQGSVVCSSSSRKYPGTEGTNQNRHWNHHRWHATNSLERTRLSCWCLKNHKGCTYRAPVRYVTKTWSVVLLNKRTHILLLVYGKLLKPRQSFWMTLFIVNTEYIRQYYLYSVRQIYFYIIPPKMHLQLLNTWIILSQTILCCKFRPERATFSEILFAGSSEEVSGETKRVREYILW